MRASLSTLVASLMLVGPAMSSAQDVKHAELLSPVPEATVSGFGTRTRLELKPTLYFAKRYRIVQVDIDVLEQDEPITISPFPDVTVTVTKEDVEQLQENIRVWRGQITEPAPPIFYDSETGVLSPERRGLAAAVTIYITTRSVPLTRTQAHDILKTDPRALIMSNVPLDGGQEDGRDPVISMVATTVSGNFSLFKGGEIRRFVLTPFESDPRYYVVYEQDRSKMQGMGGGREVEIEKARRVKEFLDELENEWRIEEARDNATER